MTPNPIAGKRRSIAKTIGAGTCADWRRYGQKISRNFFVLEPPRQRELDSSTIKYRQDALGFVLDKILKTSFFSRKTADSIDFKDLEWCGREDSNFHGFYPTATSTLRVYQFRHDRTPGQGAAFSKALTPCEAPSPGIIRPNGRMDYQRCAGAL